MSRVLIAALLLCPFAALGSPTTEAGAAINSSVDVFNSMQLFKVIAALLVTVVAIFLLSGVAKKARWGRSLQGQHLKLIDSMAVGTRDRIMLIEVDHQRIVIGASPGQMRALHSFSIDANTAESFEDALSVAKRNPSDDAAASHRSGLFKRANQ